MKMLFKKYHLARFIVGLGALLLATGCSTTKPVGIYTAAAGSAFLPYGQGVAKFLGEKGIRAEAFESKGSIENLQKVNAEPSLLGTAFLGTTYEGFTGTGSWTGGQKLTNVRALFPMYETAFHVAVLRWSDVRSIKQLDGKRVGVGPAGGPGEVFFRGLVQDAGIKSELVNGSATALAKELEEGKIDALWQGAAVPIPILKELSDKANAVVFALSEAEAAAMLKRFPFLTRMTTPAYTYRGQHDPIGSVGAWNFVVAHKDLPEADAYAITKAVLSASDPKTQINSAAGPTRAQNAVANTFLPFHPGALKYYRETGAKLAAP